jgi:hypothetical protein
MSRRVDKKEYGDKSNAGNVREFQSGNLTNAGKIPGDSWGMRDMSGKDSPGFLGNERGEREKFPLIPCKSPRIPRNLGNSL